ncbi:MAG: STAS domain-containing protein [Phycisphaerales bacterium]|nr:STAS domain-containing protein [Phycisphaerales bacterium]
MKITQQTHGQVTVIGPHGPLTSDELAGVRLALDKAAAARAMRVVLSMANVPFVDSAGIEMLLELSGNQALAMKRVKLAALSDCTRDALDVTDVLSRLDVYRTVDDAIQSCRR